MIINSTARTLIRSSISLILLIIKTLLTLTLIPAFFTIFSAQTIISQAMRFSSTFTLKNFLICFVDMILIKSALSIIKTILTFTIFPTNLTVQKTLTIFLDASTFLACAAYLLNFRFITRVNLNLNLSRKR